MKKKQAYLIGIKGVAMTAMAVYLKESGFSVTGSDVTDIFATDKILTENKIRVQIGFEKKNITRNLDLVVVTGAHGGMTNPQAQYARELGIPTYMHGRYLGEIMKGKVGISVAGCHGKTTTSSMIASLLMHADYDPSYSTGSAQILDLGPAGHFGHGKFFIAEADEYMTCPVTDPRPRFLWQFPRILVVTNIEYDHPDAYKSLDSVKDTFLRFTGNVETGGVVIACLDSPNIRKILPRIKREVITYGFSPAADYHIYKYYFGDEVSFMRIKYRNFELGEFMINVPGRHNLLNALAAGVAANQAGMDWTDILGNLKKFKGCKRRFEQIARMGNKSLYDDYAHHPTEISATIQAAKNWFPDRRIVVIFQPHTYSRTKSLLKEFAQAFREADMAIIADIYPSARENYDSTINSLMLVRQMNLIRKNAYYKKDKEEVILFLKNKVADGDLVITMGAGDIFLWHDDLIRILK